MLTAERSVLLGELSSQHPGAAPLSTERRAPRRAHSSTRKDILHGSVDPGREVAYTWIGLLITVVASVLLSMEIAGALRGPAGDSRSGTEQVVFGLVVAGLVYGNLVYQLARIGYMLRLRRQRRISSPDPFRLHPEDTPRLAVLVPSYKEEVRIVRQALMSSVLQRYPRKRVVLLIDDCPEPRRAEDRLALEAARAAPREIQRELDACLAAVEEAASAFRRRTGGDADVEREREELARTHDALARWYRGHAAKGDEGDHTDRLFARMTFVEPAADHENRAAALRAGESLTVDELEREYVLLESFWRVEVTSFERKRYANLSHEPNKAMNLNSYIGLLGNAYAESAGSEGVVLRLTAPAEADLIVPEADYLVTLDADSILHPDYAARLVSFMEEPGNEPVAVAQTPYSAVPEPEGLLERIAGATTDIQYNVHQGFAARGATYWVGANALLRVTALRDICETEHAGTREVRRYVSDRTVIEDTESSVDLLAKGWQLHNHPERLSFSATPSDFGALTIQRRRWSNGGLIILPKLLRYLWRRRNPLAKTGEGFFRIHYLLSPALVNLGVPLLLCYPFEDHLRSVWLPLTALPYFFFYGRDMVHLGYRASDLLRVYALNLMLIPVNLGGVFGSLRQIATGRTIAFQRTPKIVGKTSPPSGLVHVVYAFTLYAYVAAGVDVFGARYWHALFALVNAGFLSYAVLRYLHAVPVRAEAPAAGERAAAVPWERRQVEGGGLVGNVPQAQPE